MAVTLGLRLCFLPAAFGQHGDAYGNEHASNTPIFALPATVIRHSPDIAWTAGASPANRDTKRVRFDSAVEVYEHEVDGWEVCDYDPPKLRRPEIDPTEYLWSNAVAGFFDPCR